MNHLNTAAIAAAAILAMTPALSTADDGFYIGGSVGSASLNEDFDGFDVDTDSTAFRLIAGWQFNEHFSLEGGYHNFGTFEQALDSGGERVNIRLKADGFTVGATAALPLGQKFAIYGRAGSFFWDGDADINGVSQAKPEDTNLYFGAGVKYKLSDRVALVCDWTRFQLTDTSSSVASIGLTFGF